jgi:hypothetical protein
MTHEATPTAAVLAAGEWFVTGADRAAVCRDCGEPFTQHKLAPRFLAAARNLPALAGQPHAIDREIPDGYVPLFCPPCEHRALGDEGGHVPTFVPMRKGKRKRDPNGPQSHEPVVADDYPFF